MKTKLYNTGYSQFISNIEISEDFTTFMDEIIKQAREDNNLRLSAMEI